jgi:hypothetical protein
VHRVLRLQLHQRPAAKAAVGLLPPLLPLHQWLWGQATAGTLPSLLRQHQRLGAKAAEGVLSLVLLQLAAVAGVRPCGGGPATYASQLGRAFHPMQLQLDMMSNLILENCRTPGCCTAASILCHDSLAY